MFWPLSRCCICRAVLYHVKSLRFTCILCFRFLGAHCRDSRTDDRNSHNSLYVLYFVRRRISVCVATSSWEQGPLLNEPVGGTGARSWPEGEVHSGSSFTVCFTGPHVSRSIPLRASRYISDTCFSFVYSTSSSPVRPLVLRDHFHNSLSSGTIGFLASYWAVRRLYGAIRVD